MIQHERAVNIDFHTAADGPVAAGPLIVVRNHAQLKAHDAKAWGELIADRRRKYSAR